MNHVIMEIYMIVHQNRGVQIAVGFISSCLHWLPRRGRPTGLIGRVSCGTTRRLVPCPIAVFGGATAGRSATTGSMVFSMRTGGWSSLFWL